MKHTIIACDMCDQRIYRDGWLIEEGAVKFPVRLLEQLTGATVDMAPVTFPGWRRRKLYICPECVEKIKGLCKGKEDDHATD